jgi:hypothetical protein
MRRASRFFLPAIVAFLALLAAPGSAHAGEPLHPIIQPLIDFVWFFAWF